MFHNVLGLAALSSFGEHLGSLLWCVLILVSLFMVWIGVYRKHEGNSWKLIFISGTIVFVSLIALTLFDSSVYNRLSSIGWVRLFMGSFSLILPLVLIFFGAFLFLNSGTRFPGLLLTISGFLGVVSTAPFVVDPLLKMVYGDTSFTARGMIRLSLPYFQQVGMLRILAETAGIMGLFLYLKQRPEAPVAVVSQVVPPVKETLKP